ncbi:hypothetical protein [Streptomyces flavofungini]|uniref:hypothetical protein n=1 Tax=Streptomyces flavofungini TaxID=68200 RepID=UPI0025B003C5|nr:hypothetical protein [Streptomyces flavofungini]WJV44309.1 hypothetical protein QUY26_01390 [Streptomyces flavofungini]
MPAGFGVPALCGIGALVAAAGVAAMALPGRPEPWPVHLMRRAATMAACAADSRARRAVVTPWSRPPTC